MLAGMENGAVIMENSMEAPQKIKLRAFSGGTVVKNRPGNNGAVIMENSMEAP